MAGGQVWGIDAQGGFMYSDELSDTLRTALQPMVRFRQFCDARDATEKGLHSGEEYNWNIYSDVETQGTVLPEYTGTGATTALAPMPETYYTISQGSLTVTEQGNSVPFSQKLDNLSKHPVKEVVQKVLKNDANKALDTAAYDQFDSTRLTAVGAGAAGSETVAFAVDGTLTGAAVPMLTGHVKLIVDEMKERDIPAYDGTHYFCLARPSTYRPLKDELEDIRKYIDAGYQQIMNGEVGRYEGVRFVEQTNIASAGYTAGDKAYFFGEDTVAEAIVVPEEIRGRIPGDYGRAKGVAWYYLGGFGIVHNVTGAAQNRIVKWGGAS
ncbi:MAG: hypothetical protein DRJ15_10565 [Bacteroidetes bacterium]|nr:MAG: hypothetical protein DRJ15_10565 [Bacteroidota bacterium]